jgi:hypothetical protein
MRRVWRYVPVMTADSALLDEARADLHIGGRDISRPDHPRRDGTELPSDERLQKEERRCAGHIIETQKILQRLEHMKGSAGSAQDWMTIMHWVSVQRSRVNGMCSEAEGIYDRVYWLVYEKHRGSGGESRGSQKDAELKAKAQASVFLQAKKRLESAGAQLGDEVWMCRSTMEHMRSEEMTTFSYSPGPLLEGFNEDA